MIAGNGFTSLINLIMALLDRDEHEAYAHIAMFIMSFALCAAYTSPGATRRQLCLFSSGIAFVVACYHVS